MKKFLPVFLAFCLGLVPVFGEEDVTASEAETAAVNEALTAVESQDDVAMQAATEESVVAMVEAEAAPMFGSDVPQISLLSAFGAMGLVLCLLVGAYFGIKKFAPGYFPATASSGNNLKIVESLGMGDRRSIALVEVGGKRFLIGSTPQQVNMLTALPEHISLVDEDSPARVASAVNDGGERKTFRSMFEIGRNRPDRHSEKVLPDEIRQKMRRLREALENR